MRNCAATLQHQITIHWAPTHQTPICAARALTLTPQSEDGANVRPTCKLSYSDGHQACAALQFDLNSVLLQYEAPGAQEAARSAMPLDRLNAAAADAAALSRHMGEEPPLHRSDALVQEMLAWFKAGFFTWVRPPADARVLWRQ
jgi:hypothetical protein